MYENFNYIRGTPSGAESVEFDIRSQSGEYITTCVVNVNRFLNGIKTHPCGDGDDLRLGKTTDATVLKTLREGRSGIKYSGLLKTFDAWNGSGLSLFDFLAVGDKVDDALVEEQRDCVPPHRVMRGYMQAGEAFRHIPDGLGDNHPTYTTFTKMNGSTTWTFVGYCFSGEAINRVQDNGIVLKAV